MASSTREPEHHDTAHDKPKGAKLAETFVPNEPLGGPTGVDKEGKPDGSLSVKQQARAATEALLSLRPQPSADEIQKVLAALEEVDEHGVAKHKTKTAKDAGGKAVEELNRQRTAA